MERGLCENWLMAGGMDLVVLRQLIGGVLDDFARMWRHQDIGPECERLGLPESPPSLAPSKIVKIVVHRADYAGQRLDEAVVSARIQHRPPRMTAVPVRHGVHRPEPFEHP